jgi:hypothetical protein
MEFLNSKKFIWIMIIMIVCLGLFGCAKPKINADQNKHTTIDTIGKLDSIANVLGCMFGSTDPICDKKSSTQDSDEDWKDLESNPE